jgi:hypothetical protein
MNIGAFPFSDFVARDFSSPTILGYNRNSAIIIDADKLATNAHLTIDS